MEVAEKHKMPLAAFRSKSRTVPFINLRHEACYRLSTELGFSLMQIGRLMGNRDHTTVLNAIRRHKKILAEGYKPKTRTKSSVSSARVTQVEPQTQHDHG
jgi:chromosomal replication initiator protein